MNKLIAFIICSIISVNSNALGRVISYDEITRNYFGTIQKISSCGGYKIDEQHGEYRLIESYICGGEMLFIDKVKYENSLLQVVRGFTFSEINSDHAELYLEDISCKSENNTNVIITGKVNGSGHEENYRFNFTINLDTTNGKYEFTENFNK